MFSAAQVAKMYAVERLVRDYKQAKTFREKGVAAIKVSDACSELMRDDDATKLRDHLETLDIIDILQAEDCTIGFRIPPDDNIISP